MTTTKLRAREQRVFNLVKERGVVTTREIFAETLMQTGEISDVLLSLERRELIVYVRGNAGRPGKVELKT